MSAAIVWGPVEVFCLAHIEDRGYALKVETPSHKGHRGLEIWVSEGGRSIRCWIDGKELVAESKKRGGEA